MGPCNDDVNTPRTWSESHDGSTGPGSNPHSPLNSTSDDLANQAVQQPDSDSVPDIRVPSPRPIEPSVVHSDYSTTRSSSRRLVEPVSDFPTVRTRSGRMLRLRAGRILSQHQNPTSSHQQQQQQESQQDRQRRHVLQDMARPLKQWLIRHRDHPYPSKEEKVALALGSQMTLVQVSNWFANARRRLKNTVKGPGLTWGQRVRMYNSYVSGNAETLSISSDDSIWDTDSEEEPATGADMCTELRLYHEHEEHSYFASGPLKTVSTHLQLQNRKPWTNMPRKRRHSSSSSGSDSLEARNDLQLNKLPLCKRPCTGVNNYHRCIHSNTSCVFKNSMVLASEEVKLSPESKEASNDSEEDTGYQEPASWKRARSSDDSQSDDSDEAPHGGWSPESGTLSYAKYKSAILHRYLQDSGNSNGTLRVTNTEKQQAQLAVTSKKVTEPERRKRKRSSNREEEETEEDLSSLEKKRRTERQPSAKRRSSAKSNSDDRISSELEAAEALTTLSRTSNGPSNTIRHPATKGTMDR